MPTDSVETFVATFCIWDFQDKCLSSKTLKNRASFTRSRLISLIEKCQSSFSLFCFVWNRINFDFFKVNRKLIILKPAWSFLQFVIHNFHLLFLVVKICWYRRQKVWNPKPLTHYNNNGPKTDPWGTLHLMCLEKEL